MWAIGEKSIFQVALFQGSARTTLVFMLYREETQNVAWVFLQAHGSEEGGPGEGWSKSLFAGNELTSCPIQKFQVVQNRERKKSFVASAKSHQTESVADGTVTLVDP